MSDLMSYEANLAVRREDRLIFDRDAGNVMSDRHRRAILSPVDRCAVPNWIYSRARDARRCRTYGRDVSYAVRDRHCREAYAKFLYRVMVA